MTKRYIAVPSLT